MAGGLGPFLGFATALHEGEELPGTGVLLRWSGTDSDGTTQTLEAIEVGEPDPPDFEPTGPVQEMPGMGDQDG